ncbi:MAG: hypothetical protein EBR07_01115, partial [Planctomycetes bacterium]|nr:hypothetical protein [Planctomycetota bacterium]
DLLILDEPTSGLDPLGSRQVKDLLLDLGRRGKTILLSSHQLDDVQDVCDRMVILYGGKIRSEGTVDELLEDSGRTVITTPRLDAATVTTIERIIRETAHVEVERVAAPRQRLEDLFLQIVERARNDRASTSGAGAGGPTAAFLRGEENAGIGLIAELETMAQVAKPVAPVAATTPVAPAADAAVLTELVTGKPSAPVGKVESATSPSKTTKAPAPPQDVDRSVIDDLLGGGGNP